jgi:hypothetical protein
MPLLRWSNPGHDTRRASSLVRGAECRELNSRIRRREKNVLDIPFYRPGRIRSLAASKPGIVGQSSSCQPGKDLSSKSWTQPSSQVRICTSCVQMDGWPNPEICLRVSSSASRGLGRRTSESWFYPAARHKPMRFTTKDRSLRCSESSDTQHLTQICSRYSSAGEDEPSDASHCLCTS